MSLPRFAEAVRWQLPAGGELLRFEGRLEVPRFPQAAAALPWWEQRLQLVRGVGPRREAGLRARGYGTLSALSSHRTYGARAREVLELVRRREVGALRRRGARDAELTLLFGLGEVAAFDVETLGLAPVFPAFLVGLAWQEAAGWAYLQLLVPHPDHEAALLLAIDELVRSRFSALVTYNGRCFDLPYLGMRRLYHGIGDGSPWPPVPCLDLLGEVRRRLKPLTGSARLGDVGAYVTCHPRQGEVGSHEVPLYYQRFLQTGDPALIEPVLAHNYHDLCALVAVWTALCSRDGHSVGAEVQGSSGRPHG